MFDYANNLNNNLLRFEKYQQVIVTYITRRNIVICVFIAISDIIGQNHETYVQLPDHKAYEYRYIDTL